MKHQIPNTLAKAMSPSRAATALTLAAAVTLFAGQALAQSTSGHIFGHGPAGAKVEVQSSAGAHRTVTINDSGRYNVRSLPTGTYTVTLLKDDTTVDTRRNIGLMAGRGAEITLPARTTSARPRGRTLPDLGR